MTAQIISLQQKRQERGLPAISSGHMWWMDASLMLTPWALAWVHGMTFAERFNTQPAIILEFTDEPA